ncbi:MAG: hypothetical protein ACK5AZ_26320 [Bryobacteraceae bacterium]
MTLQSITIIGVVSTVFGVAVHGASQRSSERLYSVCELLGDLEAVEGKVTSELVNDFETPARIN